MKHYDQNTERLVNALFDNTVPEHLQSSPTTSDSNLIRERINDYDQEQFEVFNQKNIEEGRVFRGKKYFQTMKKERFETNVNL